MHAPTLMAVRPPWRSDPLRHATCGIACHTVQTRHARPRTSRTTSHVTRDVLALPCVHIYTCCAYPLGCIPHRRVRLCTRLWHKNCSPKTLRFVRRTGCLVVPVGWFFPGAFGLPRQSWKDSYIVYQRFALILKWIITDNYV